MFALLGARVTVFDLSQETASARPRCGSHYSLAIETVQGDMRDLSCFEDARFDIVWHPYAINFIPDVHVVFRQVARILRRDGLYHLQCSNPFLSGMTRRDWNGEGYVLKRPYVQGAEIAYADQPWVYERDGVIDPIPGPIEYLHNLEYHHERTDRTGFLSFSNVSDYSSMKSRF